MSSLFIDTSNHLSIGLLGDDFRWEKYTSTHDVKSSGVIHHLINELLSDCGKRVQDIGMIFLVNGPGSYTGVRVGEGIAQVFEWQKIETISFHHFQVPFFAGVSKGVFICSAFKGEFFIHSWNKSQTNQKLMTKSDLEENTEICAIDQLYSNQAENDLSITNKIISTHDLIHDESQLVFSELAKLKIRLDPFYFRKLSDEFKREKKDK